MDKEFRWVHISDIHFQTKNKSFNTKELIEALPPYLSQKIVDKVDALILSGDFRYAPEHTENTAKVIEFIKELVNSLKLYDSDGKPDFSKVITVPGNHDLNRTDVRKYVIKGAQEEYDAKKGTFETYCSNNTSFIETTLKCEGTARWDWRECKTTFNITSLKFTVGDNDPTEILPLDSMNNQPIPIDIEKPYVENSDNNDIKESDILVNLLQNNKLFHTDDNRGNKYVFNKVDLSKMKYCCFPSMYVYISSASKKFMYLPCLKCAILKNDYSYRVRFTISDDYKDICNYYNKKNKWTTRCIHNRVDNNESYIKTQLTILNNINIPNREINYKNWKENEHCKLGV